MSLDLLVANFGLDAYKEANTTGESVILSPFSIFTALSMVYLGASGNTKEQIKSQLFQNSTNEEELKTTMAKLINSLNSMKQENVSEVYLANRLFGDTALDVLPEYTNTIKTYFNGDMELLSFAESEKALNIMNGWVTNTTKGKIKNLVPSNAVNSLTRLVLVNAIYFKSSWRKPFLAENTKTSSFYVDEQTEIPVQMMHNKKNFLYTETDEIQILGIPYANEQLTMYILLPKEMFALAKVLSSLNGERLLKLVSQTTERNVEVNIPKFKVEEEWNLRTILEAMGISDLFQSESADLSKITGKKNLFVSGAFHKAFIEVNEKGSEAAAATAIVTMLRSITISHEALNFKADHPFIFTIIDEKHKTLLFLGDYRGDHSNERKNVKYVM